MNGLLAPVLFVLGGALTCVYFLIREGKLKHEMGGMARELEIRLWGLEAYDKRIKKGLEPGGEE